MLLGMVLFRSFLPQAKAILPKCILFESTGIFCPGCGGTRAAEALVFLNFSEAIRQNAWATSVVIVGLPLLLLAALSVRYPQAKLLAVFHWRRWITWFLAGTIVLFGILRNFPAFDWLAPVER